MDWLNECTSGENLPNGLYRTQIGIAPRAVRLDGYLREIVASWQQGDADLPHLVSQAPIAVGTADSGRRRLYPVPGDLSRYIEIGAPLIKPAGSWVSVGFSGAIRTGNRITWSRPQANMSIVHAGHYVKLDIELRNGYVPPNRQFAFPVSLVGLTRSGARILADGQPVMLLRPPVVYDAANPMDTRPITWTFGAIGGQTGVLFTLPSLAGMARPVVDPTFSSQPAAAAGQDTLLIDGANADKNYGINTLLSTGLVGVLLRRGLLQFDLSTISGTVTAATLSLYNTDAEGTTASGTLQVHRILAANAGWAEGTVNDAIEAGSACWNYKAYNTANWAGSVGLGTSGTDYSATQIGTANWTDGVAATLTLTLDLTEFASMVAANAGFRLSSTDEATAGKAVYIASSDHLTSPRPLLTAEYTPAASSPSGGSGRGRSTLCREARNRWL